jgi:oligopeptide/dipeptide ABC transporter ATP-binding protein
VLAARRVSAPPIAELAGVSVRYGRGAATSWGLRDITLRVETGETLAIVGASGSGKSTLGRVLLMLQPPSEGAVRLRGEDLTTLTPRALRARRADMQMMFQDPFASLNGRMRIGETLAEPLVVHGRATWRGARGPVAAALGAVGLPPDAAARFPHEFSGGQRQRIAIARALMLEPALVVADEPLSALDLTVAGQILDLLATLRARLGITLVLVSHDLPLVRDVADRVAVMFAGRIVEEGPAASVLDAPAHPYTRALREAVPIPDPAAERARHAHASPARADLPPAQAGCPYASRCPLAAPPCAAMPPVRAVAPGWRVSCWFAEEPHP